MRAATTVKYFRIFLLPVKLPRSKVLIMENELLHNRLYMYMYISSTRFILNFSLHFFSPYSKYSTSVVCKNNETEFQFLNSIYNVSPV